MSWEIVEDAASIQQEAAEHKASATDEIVLRLYFGQVFVSKLRRRRGI
jgi:hypothetical protein